MTMLNLENNAMGHENILSLQDINGLRKSR